MYWKDQIKAQRNFKFSDEKEGRTNYDEKRSIIYVATVYVRYLLRCACWHGLGTSALRVPQALAGLQF